MAIPETPPPLLETPPKRMLCGWLHMLSLMWRSGYLRLACPFSCRMSWSHLLLNLTYRACPSKQSNTVFSTMFRKFELAQCYTSLDLKMKQFLTQSRILRGMFYYLACLRPNETDEYLSSPYCYDVSISRVKHSDLLVLACCYHCSAKCIKCHAEDHVRVVVN